MACISENVNLNDIVKIPLYFKLCSKLFKNFGEWVEKVGTYLYNSLDTEMCVMSQML